MRLRAVNGASRASRISNSNDGDGMANDSLLTFKDLCQFAFGFSKDEMTRIMSCDPYYQFLLLTVQGFRYFGRLPHGPVVS